MLEAQTRRCKIGQVLSPSPHFEVVQLADGIYAAIARDGSAAISNAGIIDIGEHTLIFDSFLTPRAAADLRVTAEMLTGRQIQFVINSHWHGDHIRGNQVFSPETEIISSNATRQLIRTEGTAELHEDIENSAQSLRDYENQLSKEKDEGKRADILYDLICAQQVAESAPKVKLRLPNWTFDGKLVFHGDLHTAELIELGTGHTQNDSILLLPDARIAFVSDLLFVESHPSLKHSDLEAWLHSLDMLEGYNLEKFVPGHGPVGVPGDVILMRQYIHDLEKIAARLVKQGKPIDSVNQQRIPERYSGWKLKRFFYANLRFLFNRLSPSS